MLAHLVSFGPQLIQSVKTVATIVTSVGRMILVFNARMGILSALSRKITPVLLVTLQMAITWMIPLQETSTIIALNALHTVKLALTQAFALPARMDSSF